MTAKQGQSSSESGRESRRESRSTTVARLTGESAAAICVLAIEGPNAGHWIDQHWTPAQGAGELRVDTIRFGLLGLDSSVGESIVVCRTSPESYELHCHGGKAAAATILSQMAKNGIVVKSQQEWCVDHQPDPIVAAAKLALLSAKTSRTARILLDQTRGALSRVFAEIDQAVRVGNHELVRTLAEQLRSWDTVGRHLTSPFEVLLCGPPNVGKSSLMNRILGYQRAIVHEQAGTTRDLLTEESSIEGWPVKLHDSAGIRESRDRVEQVGVQRSVQASHTADLQLILVDPTEGWQVEHQKLFDRKPDQSLVVVTKSDLQLNHDTGLPECQMETVSALTGDGIPGLLRAIAKRLVPIEPPENQAVMFTDDQREWLNTITAS